MTAYLVDTNVLLRFVKADDRDLAPHWLGDAGVSTKQKSVPDTCVNSGTSFIRNSTNKRSRSSRRNGCSHVNRQMDYGIIPDQEVPLWRHSGTVSANSENGSGGTPTMGTY